MRSFLRLVLLPFLLASFLLFGSIHQERWTADDGAAIEVVEVGAPAPWLVWHRERSHADEAAYIDDVVRRAEAAARPGASGTASLTYRRSDRWNFDFLSVSMLAGAVCALLAVVHRRLASRPAAEVPTR